MRFARALALLFSYSMASPDGEQQRLQRHLQDALAAHKGGELDLALENYRTVLSINSGLPAVHNNAAAVALALGQPEAAEASWRAALTQKPDYAEAHYNLAVLLSERGDPTSLADARHHCAEALEHKPGYVQGHHLMGNILASLERADAAAGYYAQAQDLATDASSGARLVYLRR